MVVKVLSGIPLWFLSRSILFLEVTKFFLWLNKTSHAPYIPCSLATRITTENWKFVNQEANGKFLPNLHSKKKSVTKMNVHAFFHQLIKCVATICIRCQKPQTQIYCLNALRCILFTSNQLSSILTLDVFFHTIF